jgi:hypothetical protein
VIADLGVVEHAPVGGADPVLGQDAAREGAVGAIASQGIQGLLNGCRVILGQVAGVGTGVGERLVLFVKGLGERQRGFGAEAEASVGLALQGGEVEEQGGKLGGRLAFLGDDAGFAEATVAQGPRGSCPRGVRV